MEARKLEHDHLQSPKPTKEKHQHKSSYIHVPTSWRLLYSSEQHATNPVQPPPSSRPHPKQATGNQSIYRIHPSIMHISIWISIYSSICLPVSRLSACLSLKVRSRPRFAWPKTRRRPLRALRRTCRQPAVLGLIYVYIHIYIYIYIFRHIYIVIFHIHMYIYNTCIYMYICYDVCIYIYMLYTGV